MRRTNPLQTFASSPTMVGAITTLVIVVAVFLAYNANNGLPFVPVYRVSVEVPNSARVTKSNEVRIGGHRVGVVESIEPIRTTPDGQAAQSSTTDNSSNQPGQRPLLHRGPPGPQARQVGRAPPGRLGIPHSLQVDLRAEVHRDQP